MKSEREIRNESRVSLDDRFTSLKRFYLQPLCTQTQVVLVQSYAHVAEQ